MRQVRRAVYKLLPRIRITDLLLEVDATVGFTHLHTGDPYDNPLALCTTLLAGAINLGIEKMALASHHTNYDRLAWIMDWLIRDDSYANSLTSRCLTHLLITGVRAHIPHRTHNISPLATFNPHSPHAIPESGIAFYTHVSDQHSPFFTQVISTRIREAP